MKNRNQSGVYVQPNYPSMPGVISPPEFVADVSSWSWESAGNTAVLNCMNSNNVGLASFTNPLWIKKVESSSSTSMS
jgi:hypothetical protein